MRLVWILLGLLLAQPVWAEWKNIETVNIGTKSEAEIYAKLEGSHVTGKTARMWFLFDFKFPQKSSTQQFKSIRVLDEYDCAEERKRTLSLSMFSKGMGDGPPFSNSDKATDWSYIAPATTGHTILRMLCG
jgi:hypothetical protein